MTDVRDVPGVSLWLLLCRVLALLAIAASAALYVQYLNPADGVFCSVGSSCDQVRRSGFGYFGHPALSLPLVGLIGYIAVFWVSIAEPAGKWLVRLSAVGALIALSLIGLQAFYVHAFCWLCLTVDGAAVVLAALALLHRGASRDRGAAVRDPLRPSGWVMVGGLALAGPIVWANVKPLPPVPAVIRALYVPGAVNVVEFADFECPYCRALHPVLQEVLRDHSGSPVHFVRKHVPLDGHPDARPAARAAICAEEQGKGEALADRLMNMEPLSPPAERRAALELGVDAVRFDECLASKRPDERIAADRALLETAGMVGLPTTYVQGKRFLGVAPKEALRDELDRAARGASDTGVPAPVFLAGLLGLLGVALWLGRAPRGTVLDGSRS